MTRLARGKWGLILLVAAIAAGTFWAVPARADEENRYLTYTVRGKLSDPDTDKPMAGATLRFVSVEEGGERLESVTGPEGLFEIKGLTPGRYALEIETAEGEHIRGVSAFNLTENTSNVVMKISDRFVSETSVDLKPERFVAAVDKKAINWKRFWTEMGIFLGAGIGAAAGFL